MDQLLRHLVTRTFVLDEVVSMCESGTRKIESFDDLAMGDYQRILENPTNWAKLGWPLDRPTFVRRLDELRELRNDIMHFNPDPISADAIDKLRNVLRLLREYGD